MGGTPGAQEPEASGQGMQLLLSMNDFANFKQIGKGKDCVVYSASCEKLGGNSVVLKVYDKAKISAIKHRSVRREARIMRYLTDKRIPHTTAYTGAFQDSKQIYIVMEHCKGGDLLEQLLKEGRAMPEKRVVREVVLPSLTALAHLHAAGIIHRDIKLENLFISSCGHLQLGDFGLAISVLEERAISPVGTLEYMAPEILRLPSTDLVLKGVVRVEDINPIDEKVDVWSFGVTVYELVTGRSPFEGGSKDEIKAAILGFQMRPLPGFLTPGCQDFILKCLCPKAGDRPSALALLSHPWVQLHCTPADLVTIARLPLQLPKVPMGYKPNSTSSSAAKAPAAGTAAGQEQQQQAAGESESSSAAGTAMQSPALTPREAVSVGGKPSPRFMQVSDTKNRNSSSTSSPDSPQIPAFMPSPGPMGAGPTSSSASVASAMCSHMDTGRSSSSSRSSSSMQGPASAGSSHAPHSIDHTVSTDSMRSNGGVSTNDSVTSMYQQSLASMAAGLVGGSSSCSPYQASSLGKGWAAAAVASAPPAGGWAHQPIQEPIQESPTDESAATAASMVAASGRSEHGSFSGRQQPLQQQQQQQQQQHLVGQQEPAANSMQQAEEEDMQALFASITSSKALAAQTQAQGQAGGAIGHQEKHRKSPNGGKRLWRWCVAAVAASPNASS